MKDCNYSFGKKNGNYKEYYENGQTMKDNNYIDDKKTVKIVRLCLNNQSKVGLVPSCQGQSFAKI